MLPSQQHLYHTLVLQATLHDLLTASISRCSDLLQDQNSRLPVGDGGNNYWEKGQGGWTLSALTTDKLRDARVRLSLAAAEKFFISAVSVTLHGQAAI